MIRLRRWPIDYGRGPMRWVLVQPSHRPWPTQGTAEAFGRSAYLTEALRHPIRAYRWLVHGMETKA